MKIQNKLKLITWFVCISIIAVPLIMWANWGWSRYIEDVALVQQTIIYEQLQHYISTGKQAPKTLTEVINFEDWKKPLKVYYYPDAWSKADRILLVTPLRSGNAVTFGNNARAILSYWKHPGDDDSVDWIGPGRYAPWYIGMTLVLALVGSGLIFKFLNPARKPCS